MYFVILLMLEITDNIFIIMKNNIVLIGMPGAGKSTVGVVLAKRLGMSFVDSDLVIQDTYGKLLQELIEDYKKRSILDGRRATLLHNGKRRRVTILGIDDDARLLVETRKKEVIPVSSRSELIL